jgi:hypothetical protein
MVLLGALTALYVSDESLDGFNGGFAERSIRFYERRA